MLTEMGMMMLSAEYPYPCIRGFRFIHFVAHKNPAYKKVIEAGKDDPSSILVDIGCCCTYPSPISCSVV